MFQNISDHRNKNQPSAKPFFGPAAQLQDPLVNSFRPYNTNTSDNKTSSINSHHASSSHIVAPITIQRKCAACEKEEKLQRKEMKDEDGMADTSLERYIGGLGSSGQPLPDEVSNYYEPRFGYDFSNIRIHHDAAAAKSAASVNALAYTSGNNIVFNEGQYAPGTDSGKKLLAHELVHTMQQSTNAIAPKIQRSITVHTPGLIPTHLVSGFMQPADVRDTPPEFVDQTCGRVTEIMLNTLCPEGTWAVDRSSGLVSSGTDQFCTTGLRASSHPTSCGCLCELTAPGSLNVHIHITDEEIDAEGQTSGTPGSLAQHGHGESRADLSLPLGQRVFHVAVSGRSASPLGVGDTAVAANATGHKNLRDPSWLILGHEMCGHVRRDLSRPGGRDFEHTMSEDYDTSAVDIENAIRREHSTQTDNLGIRFGEFHDFADCRHFGLVYQIKFGARVVTLHNKFNIPHEFMMSQDADAISEDSFLNCRGRTFDPHSPQRVFKHVFAFRPEQPVAFIMSDCDNHSFAVGDKVFLEGVFAHRVIQGDTKNSIAGMWNVNLDKLFIANQDITPNYNSFSPAQPLTPGMVIIIPYDRNAAGTFFSC